MADGRRLRTRLRIPQPSFAGEVEENDIPLITADCPLWMSHPFVGDEITARGGGSVLRTAGYGSSGPDGI